VAYNIAEYTARNAANIAWMEETFAEATRRHSVAIMFISQADPGFSLFEFDAPQRDPATLVQTSGPSSTPAAAAFDGFLEFLLALRAKAIAFRKPVNYVHGDSHYFRIDKPIMTLTGPSRLQNFTRIETFGNHSEGGNNDVQWVKVGRAGHAGGLRLPAADHSRQSDAGSIVLEYRKMGAGWLKPAPERVCGLRSLALGFAALDAFRSWLIREAA